MKIQLALVTLLLSVFSSTQAQTIPSYVPQSGLVGWWPFSGNPNDLSGNGNNGTNNGATLVSDRFGNSNNAYSFNSSGSGNYITVPNSPSFGFNGDMSFSLWVKSSTLQPTATWLMKYTGPSPFKGFSSCFSTGAPAPQCAGNTARWDIGNGNPTYNNLAYTLACGGIVGDGVWHHIVGTFSGNIQSLFVDGVLVDTTYNPQNGFGANSNPLIIGKDTYNYNPSRNYNGLLDDIGIWNRALTQQEITSLYQSQNCSGTNTITADGSTTFCAGNSVKLTCSEVGATYQWQRNGVNISGATTRRYTAIQGGSYTCIANCNGSISTSNSIQVTWLENKPVTLSAAGSTAFCVGDSVTLNVTNPGQNYSIQWYRTNISLPGQTGTSLVVTQPGTYKVVTRNNLNGCSRISSSGITTTSNCRTADMAIGHHMTVDDDFSSARGFENESSQGITIYPNPNTGKFRFKYKGEDSGKANLQLMNTMGQKLHEEHVEVIDGQLDTDIQLNGKITSGIYILRMMLNGGIHDSRVVVE